MEVFMLSLQESKKRTPFGFTKRLLGKILVDGEFITPSDLEAAIEQQKKTNDQLGEILVRMGALDPGELEAVLSIQRDLSSLDDAVKVASGVRLLLGELLLRAKRITGEQLDYVLREQRRTGEKLGEILVRQGLLIEYELDAVLAFQQHLRGEAPASEKLRLGELLVTTGQITRDQLENVLKRQKLSKKKIGELLIEAGYVQPPQIESGLKLQGKLVTAALVAALSLANVVGAQKAYGGSSSGRAMSANIGIHAQVLEHTSMNVLSQIQELVVTNSDILRGYVDARAASRVQVKSNNPQGYFLVFEVMTGPETVFHSVNVLVGGREVQLSPTGGWVHQPFIRGGATTDLSYRFVLAKNAKPGTYTWPLMLSALSR